MSQDSLTARYRPQTFAQVAGQHSIKTILSRAAALGQVAPAYLFSGTRGVGKTTVARIFAKALNCQNGPAPEPCNVCSMCRQITLGAAMDVLEIDGASNTGVDNVRSLKEDVGYAPMDGRYKVIIIDEAHMLSRQAFNALLKTLEEPPGHVTFIMATTEPEKFPQTIISRCQHFVFKRLPQADLAAHLRMVLDQEQISAESSALNLLARRGAGSVRDAMSVLGQVLALGGETLTTSAVREVLGLAGHEVFFRLLEHVQARDLLALHTLLVEILDHGLDLGFFLRELGECWRNLFLLLNLGDAARSIIDLPDEEVNAFARCAPLFTIQHVHSAWQMTLDSQRRILTSMEPALALELLFYNLAMLPELLALGLADVSAQEHVTRPEQQPASTRPQMPASAPKRPTQSFRTEQQGGQQSEAGRAPLPEQRTVRPRFGQSEHAGVPQANTGPARAVPETHQPAISPEIPRTWPEFVKFCAHPPAPAKPIALAQAQGKHVGTTLVVSSVHSFHSDRLKGALRGITELARQFFGPHIEVQVAETQQETRRTPSQLREEALRDQTVREAQEIFQAKIMDVRPVSVTPKEKEI
ncbi:DNA polymerase III subunit gamma/tau [Desulfovibrionales bacterium]